MEGRRKVMRKVGEKEDEREEGRRDTRQGRKGMREVRGLDGKREGEEEWKGEIEEKDEIQR